MNYVLIDKKQLDEKGLFPFVEQLPDGRAILPLNALKAVTGLTGVDIVDSLTVKELQDAVPPTQEPVNPPMEDIEKKADSIEGEVLNG